MLPIRSGKASFPISLVQAKQVTSAIPIVTLMSDPIGTGLIASFNRPGGNVTGISVQQDELAGKRVELSREIVPGLRRLAIIAYAGNPPSLVELEQAYATARSFGLDAVKIEIRRMDDIASGLEPVRGNTEASTWSATRSSMPTGFASAPWRWVHGWQRYAVFANTLK